MSRFLIRENQKSGEMILFAENDARHMFSVLRKRVGDTVQCLDARGVTHTCILTAINAEQAEARILVSTAPPLQREDTATLLVFPLLKGGKSEWILQKGTELGAQAFVPFLFERTVSRSREDGKVERFRRVVHEACKQCEQPVAPQVTPPVTDIAAVLDTLPDAGPGNLRILCWEKEKRVYIREILRGETEKPRHITLVVGPEGGISEKEVAAFQAAGFLTAGLGPLVLRSETACLAALTICRYEFL